MLWTPSKLIARLGKEINNESSYLYWAYKARTKSSLDFQRNTFSTSFLNQFSTRVSFSIITLFISYISFIVLHTECDMVICVVDNFFGVLQNNIPVYCPGLTDGSLGDMLYFHSFHNPGLIVDIVQGFYFFLSTLYCMDDF